MQPMLPLVRQARLAVKALQARLNPLLPRTALPDSVARLRQAR
jgi:hypothetical protein